MLRHTDAPSPTIKDLAWSHPTPPFTWIHITQATIGEGTIYYEPGTGREMHARSGGQRARDHFYYKADYSNPLHPNERCTNEGIAHILMKEAIMERRYMNVNVHGTPTRITFGDIRPEHYIPTPDGAYRIDLQCDIDGPEHIKELFGGAVNIEIWSHHRLPALKVEWLRTQSIATIEFRIYPKARNQIEEEMNTLLNEGKPLCDGDFRRWTNQLAGTLNREFSPKVIFIPNDDFEEIAPQYDEVAPSLGGLTLPAAVAPEVFVAIPNASRSVVEQPADSLPTAGSFMTPIVTNQGHRRQSRTWREWVRGKWSALFE
jgi:hypothetical protein